LNHALDFVISPTQILDSQFGKRKSFIEVDNDQIGINFMFLFDFIR